MKKTLVILLLISNVIFANRPVLDSLERNAQIIFHQKPSFGRDTLLISALWELTYYSTYFREKNSKLLLDSLENLSNRTNWRVGKGMFLIDKSFFETHFLNDYSAGLSNALKAKELLKNTKNYKAIAYSNLRISSIMLWNLGNEKNDKFSIEGIKVAKEMIVLGEKTNNNDIKCMGLVYVANHYNYNKGAKNAYENLKKAEEILQKDKVSYLTQNVFYGTCGVYLSYTNNFEKALEYWDKCLKIAAVQNDYYTLSSINRLKADYFYQYAKKKDFDLALSFALESYKYANQYGVLSLISNAEKELYMVNRAKGNNTAALSFFERYWVHNDSLNREKIQKIYADYDLATKESKIHKLENTQLLKDKLNKEIQITFLTTLKAKNDSLITQKNEKLAADFELISKENQIKTLENQRLQTEANRQIMVRNLLIISLLAGIGFLFYFFKNNQILKAKNREIEIALLKGQTIERKRLAQELHDNLSAKISGIKWRLEAIEPKFDVEKHQKIYDSSVNALAEVYTDVRLIAHNLLPDELETKGLKVAIEKLVLELNSLEKTQFSNEITDELGRFNNKVEYEIYSIILELSNNILKHSEAKNANIYLKKEENGLVLKVSDNGIGFDELTNKKGMGMANLKSRVELLHGKIQFLSNNGLTVKVTLIA